MKITRRGLFAGIAAIFGAKALPAKPQPESIVRMYWVPLASVQKWERAGFLTDEEAPWIDWSKA